MHMVQFHRQNMRTSISFANPKFTSNFLIDFFYSITFHLDHQISIKCKRKCSQDGIQEDEKYVFFTGKCKICAL